MSLVCDNCGDGIVGRAPQCAFCLVCACERRKAQLQRFSHSPKRRIYERWWSGTKKGRKRDARHREKVRATRPRMATCTFPGCTNEWMKTARNGGRLYCGWCRRTMNRMYSLEWANRARELTLDSHPHSRE